MEKWMQSKTPAKHRVPRTRKPLRSKFAKRVAAHYGMPIQTFKDSDKDGVMNGLDCKPFNKRKQDVIAPRAYSGGVQGMLARKEQGRFQRGYQKTLNEIRRQETQRLLELKRIQGETRIIDKRSTQYVDRQWVLSNGKLVLATSPEGISAMTEELAVPKVDPMSVRHDIVGGSSGGGSSRTTGATKIQQTSQGTKTTYPTGSAIKWNVVTPAGKAYQASKSAPEKESTYSRFKSYFRSRR